VYYVVGDYSRRERELRERPHNTTRPRSGQSDLFSCPRARGRNGPTATRIEAVIRGFRIHAIPTRHDLKGLYLVPRDHDSSLYNTLLVSRTWHTTIHKAAMCCAALKDARAPTLWRVVFAWRSVILPSTAATHVRCKAALEKLEGSLRLFEPEVRRGRERH
jgi:hypothetical protein